MYHPSWLKAFLLFVLIAFGVVSSIPFINGKISFPSASAVPVISIDGSAAHNNIYYIRAGETSPKTITITTDVGELSHLGIDHLPHGITVTNVSSTKLQVTLENVDVPDEELPASYGITFTATSVPASEILADIILVIEPRGGQQPSVLFDRPTYQAGEEAFITVVDPHIDCNVHELNDGLNPFVEATVSGPSFFADHVHLERDEYSTNVFRGSLFIDTSGSGQMTVTYPRAGTASSQCVWPDVSQIVQDQADLSVATISFDRTVYTRDDDAGTTNAVTITVVDGAAPPAVSAMIRTETAPEPGTVMDSHVLEEPLGVEFQVPLTLEGANTYTFRDTIEHVLSSAGLSTETEWPIRITATYLDTRPDPDPEAVATVFASRDLSFIVPEGRPSYRANDTAALELVDPTLNTNIEEFNTATVTLCSYNATATGTTDNRFVVGGKSEIPLLEVDRNTGMFVSGYHLAFINASFNINDIPVDPSDWQPAGQPPLNERQLFSESHIRIIINQTTQVVAVVGSMSDCWPTLPSSADLVGKIHVSFTVEPSVPSDPDSGGRGQNVGALIHADPPLATAALINCSPLYGGDTDGDGLCNNWETGSGLKVWYPSGSANFYVFTYVNDPYPNPNHKDMLVEIDHVNNANGPTGCSNTVSYKPNSTAIANIKNAFNKGDITNPDSVKGIKLHVYYASGGGEEILPNTCVTDISVWYDNPATPGTTNTFDEVKQLYFGSSTERASTDRGKAKWQAFHYCLFIPKQTQDTSSSGVAEQLGNDCVVSLGIGGYFDNSVDEQQGTLMHELGHNLGLYHGGPNVSGNDYNINCKPNYPSVMSYIRQTTNPYSNASLTYSDDSMTSNDVPGNPFISSLDPNEDNVLQLSTSSILSLVQIVWGISSGGTMPPPASIGRLSLADIDWSNGGGISNGNSPPGSPPSEINMLGISGCTSGDTVDDKLSGADDWNGIQTSGNMNFREKNPDTFATGFHGPLQPENPTQYWALEPNTNTSRQIRAQFINTTNALVQSIANCSDPLFSSDQPSYGVGDEINISITDPDANRDPDAVDFFDVRVFSDSEMVGENFDADETGTDTGIFGVNFDTSGAAQEDTITVSSGDDVTITYTDECSQDVSFPRDFSFKVGIDHVASTNVTEAPILGAGKKAFEERLVLDSDSVRKLVLNQSGEASERISVEKAIEELKDLRQSLDGFDGGNATDDSFKESQHAVATLKFLTDSIRSLQFALDVPYQKQPFEITSLDLDCGGGDGCTIRGYSDTATSTVESFRIDPDKKRMTFHGTGQGDLVLQGSSDLMPIRNLQSATTRQDLEFEAINSTAVLFKDLPYNFKDLAVFYGPDLVSPSAPMIRALDGAPLHQAVNGSQSMIVVNLTNYELALNLTDFWQNYSSIIEIRDSDDVTVFLGWQTGILEPDSFGCIFCKNAIEVSWTPNELGNYTIRTFVLSDLQQPRILSGIKETSIEVVGSSRPNVFTDKQSYEIGQTVSVTIRDIDANNDTGVAEVLRDVRVFSDSDMVGENFDADETGEDTGVFVFTFETTSESEAGKVLASVGDSVTIVYTDDESNEVSATVTIMDRGGPSGPDGCRLVVCP